MKTEIYNIICVGIGGSLGAISRYLVSDWTKNFLKWNTFPIGTVVVNVIGCFIIGFLGALAEKTSGLNHQIKLLIFAGMLGGFTTFSSFSYETLGLFREEQYLHGMANIGISLAIGLIAVTLGFVLARFV